MVMTNRSVNEPAKADGANNDGQDGAAANGAAANTDSAAKGDTTERATKKKSNPVMLVTMLLVGLGFCFVILFVLGLLPRLTKGMSFQVQAFTTNQAVPEVFVLTAKTAPKVTKLELPGNVEAMEEAVIYARTSGFVKKWYHDIGDRVKQGELLATIDAPEVDQELLQGIQNLQSAEAAVIKSKANLQYTLVTATRWHALALEGAVTKQQADETMNNYIAAQNDYKAAQDTVSANQANVKRLKATKSFEEVKAPFDGIVTARSVETGDLITAGSTNATTQMFKVARIDPVRIFLQVPQRYVDLIKDGQSADVTVSGIHNRVYTGHVARNANELDPTARTMLTEIDVPNPDGTLLPNMYGQVKLELTRDVPPVMIPSTTVMIRPQGTMVATVGSDSRVVWKKITPGRDYGDVIEVKSGLRAGEQLIVNPSDQVQNGVKVTAKPAPSTG